MLLLIGGLSAVAIAGSEPRLSAPVAPVDVGTAATFTIAADATGVHVDGCAPIELERKEGEVWVPVPNAASCDGSVPARLVQGTLTVSLATPGPGDYRGVATWGSGCVGERNFALAACGTVGVARSAAFHVNPPPVPVQR